MIAAKTSEAKRWLQKQFATRKVKKAYLALVEGHPKEPAAQLDLPVERNPKKPQTFRVSANGKSAQTTYETVQSFKNYTLLRFRPATGRTHQLRVHAAYLNCPIVGDRLYGKPNKQLGRMFLHAAELELTLPSRQRKIFSSPLAPELQSYLETLE
jgi:23S rRNA pseudouridine1911/1915/1917 synthase